MVAAVGWYLIVTDYYSRFFEIIPLSTLTESCIIEKMKELFARYGIPDTVRSDNGPQFQSGFKKFALEYNFNHITSSPYFPQSNGAVEAAVKIAKSLLKKNDDIYLALLSYRSTPLGCGFSPCELLMSRKIKTLLPILPSKLVEVVDSRATFFEKEGRNKEKQADNYNKRHNAKDLSDLDVNDSVWVTDLRTYAKVIKKCDEPRSYLVRIGNNEYRRNRWALVKAPYMLENTVPQTECVKPLPMFVEKNTCQTNTNLSESDLPVYNESGLQKDSTCVSGGILLENTLQNPTNSVKDGSLNKVPEMEIISRPKRNSKKPVWMTDYVQ